MRRLSSRNSMNALPEALQSLICLMEMMSWPIEMIFSFCCSYTLGNSVKRQFGKSRWKYHKKCWFCNKKSTQTLNLKGFWGRIQPYFFIMCYCYIITWASWYFNIQWRNHLIILWILLLFIKYNPDLFGEYFYSLSNKAFYA